jgi:tRNA-dihydrouridine synthase 3
MAAASTTFGAPCTTSPSLTSRKGAAPLHLVRARDKKLIVCRSKKCRCDKDSTSVDTLSHLFSLANMADNTDKSLNGAGTTALAPPTVNPINPSEALKRPAPGESTEPANIQSEILPFDSATTRAEKVERNGDEQPSKRVKLEQDPVLAAVDPNPRTKGVAPIKKEYLIHNPDPTGRPEQVSKENPDDDAEASKHESQQQSKDKKQKNRGQNKARTFGSSRDALQLCKTRIHNNEFSPAECPFGDKCRMEHNLRKYLAEGKREDLTTFDTKCPIFEVKGKCSAGWKCRFAGSHSTERETADGRKELVLLDNDKPSGDGAQAEEEEGVGVVNIVPMGAKIDLRKKKTTMPKSEAYVAWLDKRQTEMNKYYGASKPEEGQATTKDMSLEERRAQFTEAPIRASEKRRIYYGPETPVLAPLTTQGNLPFRRLCVGLGAQVTWSEMAMGLPLLQGEKSEWALAKAHESEMTAPKYTPKSVVAGYDNSKDIKFGVQIAGNKPWNVLKTTEILTALCPSIRAIDLNCGCPIELLYRQGAGSALMDTPGKLEKILRGMNVVSGEVPITVKIRMGTKDNHPTADKLVQRLVLGGEDAITSGEGPCGVAAITLHGRSRQQRYTRQANWEYIAECSALVNRLKQKQAEVTDTIREADARDMTGSNGGSVYFCGNGDVYSHVDYFDAVNNANVDAAMIGRGALIKPWIFEEIQTGQYLDKSASERLQYIEQFTRFGLENWGSDEIGVGVTRRFLLEWLSFSCRYVPIGLLEHLPPQMNDRPPAFRGRNELETLLSSPNYKDWIKIRQVHDVMFLETKPANKKLVKCFWDRHIRTSNSNPSTRATVTRLRPKVKRHHITKCIR